MFKKNQTSEMIKELLKSKINPTEIKVGMKVFQVLRRGSFIRNKFQRKRRR